VAPRAKAVSEIAQDSADFAKAVGEFEDDDISTELFYAARGTKIESSLTEAFKEAHPTFRITEFFIAILPMCLIYSPRQPIAKRTSIKRPEGRDGTRAFARSRRTRSRCGKLILRADSPSIITKVRG
jgi:hypothetical protein